MILVFIFCASLVLSVNSMTTKFNREREMCEIQDVTSMENLQDLSESDFNPNNSSKPRIVICKKMKFVNSTFHEFPYNFFEKIHVKEVREIIATRVGLSSIKQGDFKMASDVLNLKISVNHIDTLVDKNFMHLESLKVLDLSSNEIRTIHNDAFEGLSENFTKLDLSHNKLLTFKEKFLIDLSRTSEGPEIYLNHNEIHVVEPVNFLDNYGLKNNKRIKLLDLSSNKLKVFGLPSLNFTSLRLNNNTIEKMISPTARELEINDNRLQEIYIGRMMVNLSASNNRISEVQCERDLKLERLQLAQNSIFSDVFNCLKFSRNLKTLDLSSNPLGYLTIDSFAENLALEDLNLANTEIKRVSYGIFGQQFNLRNLDISNNDLGHIDYYMLANLRNLESINLSGNRLKTFSGYKKLKDVSRNLSTIGLENNNWKCDYLGKMWIRLNRKKINVMPSMKPVKMRANIGGIKCSTKSDKDDDEQPVVTKKKKFF